MLDLSTFPVGGCWGQLMLLFWKLVHKTQISKLPEPTRHHNSIRLWILLSLRADLLYILQYETPCRIKILRLFWSNEIYVSSNLNLMFSVYYIAPTVYTLDSKRLRHSIWYNWFFPGWNVALRKCSINQLKPVQ